jgi:hypothetical protein
LDILPFVGRSSRLVIQELEAIENERLLTPAANAQPNRPH